MSRIKFIFTVLAFVVLAWSLHQILNGSHHFGSQKGESYRATDSFKPGEVERTREDFVREGRLPATMPATLPDD